MRIMSAYFAYQVLIKQNYKQTNVIFIPTNYQKPAITLIKMWKAVGTVNPNDNKKNRSKDQVNCQPFAQASRLRLNESQLSGQQSHQFMNEYFSKRKSTDGNLHRVLSQKTIEIRQSSSPPASLRLIQLPRKINKTDQVLGGGSVEIYSSQQIQKKQANKPKQIQSLKQNLQQKCEKIEEQLRKVRQEQSKMSKIFNKQINEFKEHMKLFEKEIAEKIEQIEVQNQKNTRQNINPQLLAKIKQESARFNEKMRDLDSRKEQLKTRYKEKLRRQ